MSLLDARLIYTAVVVCFSSGVVQQLIVHQRRLAFRGVVVGIFSRHTELMKVMEGKNL